MDTKAHQSTPKNSSAHSSTKATPDTHTNKPSSKSTDVKTSKRAGKYLIVGITITVFNYGLYSILANLIINNNDLLWLSTLISTAFSIIVAYILHSKITWKERPVTKTAVYKFLLWNVILAVAIGPWLTQLFSFFTPLYEFAYNICTNLHLPFSYEFVLTTGAFALTSLVIMILNFFFYDRFVFGKKPNL